MAKRKEEGKEKEAYEKLLRKRGLERHKERIEYVRKKISYEEEEKEKKIRMSKEKYLEYKDFFETIKNILQLPKETIMKYEEDEGKYLKK